MRPPEGWPEKEYLTKMVETTTAITAPGHGLQAGDQVAICCGTGNWANLDQPASLTSAGSNVACVNGDSFTINKNSSVGAQWPGHSSSSSR